MTGKPWTVNELASLADYKLSGYTYQQMGDELGRSIYSIKAKLASLQMDIAAAGPPLREAVGEFQQAADAAQVRKLEDELQQLKSGQAGTAIVSPQHVDNYDPGAEWATAEEDCQRRIKRASEMGHFSAKFNSGPIAVVAMSDQHIAPGTAVDLKRMREDAELIAGKDGWYCVLCGDGVNNHIAIPTQLERSTPSDQWFLYEYYLKLLQEKLLVVISGNHEAWTVQRAGVDMVSRIAQNNKLCYAPSEARLTVEVGAQSYDLAIRHQYRHNNQQDSLSCVKAWYSRGEKTFDIGVIGHSHTPALEMAMRHGQRVWFARCGSYQHSSDYSRRLGFNCSAPTCPTFILSADRKHALGFVDIRDALAAWDGLKT